MYRSFHKLFRQFKFANDSLARTALALTIAWSLLVAPLVPIIPATSFSGLQAYSATDTSSPLADLLSRTTNLYNNLFAAETAAAQSDAPGGVSSNLVFWVKADIDVFSDTGTTAAGDGAAIRQWNDQVNGNILEEDTASDQPLYRENYLNFNPGVDFDGTDDRLEDQSPSMGNIDSRSAREAFVVFQSDRFLVKIVA